MKIVDTIFRSLVCGALGAGVVLIGLDLRPPIVQLPPVHDPYRVVQLPAPGGTLVVAGREAVAVYVDDYVCTVTTEEGTKCHESIPVPTID